MAGVTTPAALRRFGWFSDLDESILQELAPHARWSALDRGDYLWHMGDHATYCQFICEGLLRIVKSNARGDETTVGIFGPGDGVGNIAVINKADYPANAIVASDSLGVIKLPGNVIFSAREKHASLANAINRHLSSAVGVLRAKVDILSAGPVPARLALLFVHLAERFGQQEIDDVSIPIPISRACIASLIAAREETVIRVLRKWKQDDWMSTSRTGFRIHALAQLEATIRSDEPEAD